MSDTEIKDMLGITSLEDSGNELKQSGEHLAANPSGFVDYVKGRRAQQLAGFKKGHNIR